MALTPGSRLATYAAFHDLHDSLAQREPRLA